MKNTLWQALRFGIVGVANTALGLTTIYTAIYYIKLSPAPANALGYAVGLVLSFALNRIWTFRDDRSAQSVLPRYAVAAVTCYLLNLAVVVIGTQKFGLGPYTVQLLGVGTYTLTMFAACKLFVFPQRIAEKA